MKTTSLPHKIEPHDGCVASAVKILGNKWTPLILLNMADCERRFCEIERSLPGISPRTLSQRLEELTEHGIITKKPYAEVPPRVDYALTNKGRDFIPVLRQMAAWGTKYGEQ